MFGYYYFLVLSLFYPFLPFPLLFLNEAGLGLAFIYIAEIVGFRIFHPLALAVSFAIIAIVLVLLPFSSPPSS